MITTEILYIPRATKKNHVVLSALKRISVSGIEPDIQSISLKGAYIHVPIFPWRRLVAT